MRAYYWKLKPEFIFGTIEETHGILSAKYIDHKLKNGEILFCRKSEMQKAEQILKDE